MERLPLRWPLLFWPLFYLVTKVLLILYEEINDWMILKFRIRSDQDSASDPGLYKTNFYQ